MKTLLFQGDSITDCRRTRTDSTGEPAIGLGDGYVSMIAPRLWLEQPEKDWRIFNRGISGNRVVDLYARWKIDCLNLKPGLLSILIGVNDTWHRFERNNGVEVPRYEEFYRRILQWTRQELPQTQFILLEPFVLPFGVVEPDWVTEIDQRRAVVTKLAKDFDAVFVPLQETFREKCSLAPQEYWLIDGVHPTPAGHQLITEAWMQAAQKLLR